MSRAFARPRNHEEQQCVRSKVFSFAKGFRRSNSMAKHVNKKPTTKVMADIREMRAMYGNIYFCYQVFVLICNLRQEASGLSFMLTSSLDSKLCLRPFTLVKHI